MEIQWRRKDRKREKKLKDGGRAKLHDRPTEKCSTPRENGKALKDV